MATGRSQRSGQVSRHRREVFTLFVSGLDSMAKRIQQLAQPKPNRLRFPDRRSVYWLDKLPPETKEAITKIDLTPRWLELSRSKKINAQVTLCPEWKVSEWALKAEPSQRLCRLALPRLPAAEWQPERPLLTPLNRSTQTAVATARLCQLAQPKRRPLQDGSAPRTRPHMPFRASAHIELLATPKNNHPKFVGEREVCWPVPTSAQKAVASPRVRELSNPKERRALYEGYNPYVITRAARSACASARVRQLSLPLQRKCSSQ